MYGAGANMDGQRPSGNLFGSQAMNPQMPGTTPFGNLYDQPSTTAISQPAVVAPTLFGGSTVPIPQQHRLNQTISNDMFNISNNPIAGSNRNGLFGISINPADPNLSLQNSNSLLNRQTLPILGQTTALGQQRIPNLGSTTQLWQTSVAPREKSIPEQIQILAEKWVPDSPQCVFQYYFYNQVPPEQVPFYVPDSNEDPRKWEEALSNRPSENAIPVLAKGFWSIGQRLEIQFHAVRHIQQRLHEINNSLDQIIEKHDLNYSARMAEARRRNFAITQRTLALAAKVQTLRNRGYSLDAHEEELKKRLSTLERSAFDPAITGRLDEIWARMTGLRARAQMVKDETDRRANQTTESDEPILSDEAKKEVTKLLRNYDVQLSHIQDELKSIGKDYNTWTKETGYESDSKKNKKTDSRKQR